jgi:formylglycine-generating enzyme required for sulfatase activity
VNRWLVHSGALVALTIAGAAIGCQAILGFQDFSGAGGSGTGGDAGVDAGACKPPRVDGGPAMVEQARLDGGCVWVDSTEVTFADYNAFLATSPSVAGVAGCEGRDGGSAALDPMCLGDAGALPASRPVSCVDWCDAQAYCGFVGKRLCTGEPTANPSSSEWVAACSNNQTLVYPYGKSYERGACRGDCGSACATLDAGSLAACKSPCGAFDMSGNVEEWTNECNGGVCAVWGGGAGSGQADLQCSSVRALSVFATDYYVGFRCCSDPSP